MENNNIKNIIIGVLVVVIIVLIAYICYDKFFSNEKIENENSNISDNSKSIEEEISEMIDDGNKYSYSEIETYFEKYLENIPIRYGDDNKLTSYDVNSLTDREISMFIWNNIWNTTTGDDNGNNRVWSVSKVESLLAGKLNLKNYSLKEMKENNDKDSLNIFGLKKVDNDYVATMSSIDGIDIIKYEVSKVEYNSNTEEVKISFEGYTVPYPNEKNILGNGTIVLKSQTANNDYPFYLEKIEIN